MNPFEAGRLSRIALLLAAIPLVFGAADPQIPVDDVRPDTPERVRVDRSVQHRRLREFVEPEYPPLARKARIRGVVLFEIIVGTDGRVKEARLLSGHPLLVPAAMKAVKQWVYRPTLVNGEPVEVVTTVELTYKRDGDAGSGLPKRA